MIHPLLPHVDKVIVHSLQATPLHLGQMHWASFCVCRPECNSFTHLQKNVLTIGFRHGYPYTLMELQNWMVYMSGAVMLTVEGFHALEPLADETGDDIITYNERMMSLLPIMKG